MLSFKGAFPLSSETGLELGKRSVLIGMAHNTPHTNCEILNFTSIEYRLDSLQDECMIFGPDAFLNLEMDSLMLLRLIDQRVLRHGPFDGMLCETASPPRLRLDCLKRKLSFIYSLVDP